MGTRKNVLYCLLISLCAIVCSGLLYQYIGIKVATSVVYRVNLDRYVFPFGVARWWDGYAAGVVLSLVFILVSMGKRWHPGISLFPSIVYTAGIYTITMTYLAFLGLMATTDTLDSSWFLLFSPFVVFVHAFVTALFFFLTLHMMVLISETCLFFIISIVSRITEFFNQDSTQKQA